MSSTNGIGSLQPIMNTIATSETKSTQQTNTAQPSASTAAANTAASSDQANLSSTGSVIAQALTGDDVRTDKVAALSEAIASGSYNISSSDVADKLIQSLLK
jgi:negative regulator of flagellin synthesis FlgM